MMGIRKASGTAAALCWILFGVTLVIRLMAGNGGMLAGEMLAAAPPEITGLPAREYQGVCAMTADYLTGITAEFQYTWTDDQGTVLVGFQAHEAAHMADCRELILLDKRVAIVCLAAAAVLTAAGMIGRGTREPFLRGILTGLRITAGAAAVLLIWALADFDGLFVTFHHAAFRNDGWLLDPRTDLLIRLMPETFFIRLGIRGLLYAAVMPAALETGARAGLYWIRKRDRQ